MFLASSSERVNYSLRKAGTKFIRMLIQEKMSATDATLAEEATRKRPTLKMPKLDYGEIVDVSFGN